MYRITVCTTFVQNADVDDEIAYKKGLLCFFQFTKLDI